MLPWRARYQKQSGGRDGGSGHHAQSAEGPEEAQGLVREAREEHHAEHVEQPAQVRDRTEDPDDPLLLEVPHGQLEHSEALTERQDGEVAIERPVDRQLLEDLCNGFKDLGGELRFGRAPQGGLESKVEKMIRRSAA